MKGHRTHCGCRAMFPRLLRPYTVYNATCCAVVDRKMKKK